MSAARLRMAVVAWCVAAACATTPSAAGEDRPALAPRLSSADAAMEYWDVTAWFETGERVAARFLVTNQGPGDRTAAAVGHVVLADGRTLPFHWGRRRDAWTLGAEGRRLAIGKAALDLSGDVIVLTVTSKKRGVDLRLEIERGAVSTSDDLEVLPPAAARARIGTSSLIGTGALTHTWADRDEADVFTRRDEILARAGDGALYLAVSTLVDGSRQQRIVWHRGTDGRSGGGGTITFSGPSITDAPEYPVHSTWTGDVAGIRLNTTLERAWLRMNPLDVLPQPFRFLLSLGGKPQRVWADARVKLDGRPTELRGVAVSTFARPVER